MSEPESQPQSRSRRSTVRRIVVLCLFVGIVGTMLWLQSQTQFGDWTQVPVARAGAHDITREEVILELRQSLWRKQLQWSQLSPLEQQQQRELALEKLIDSHLLEQAAQSASLNESAIQQEAERRVQQNIRQFENLDVWKNRAAGQGLTENLFRDQLLRETRITLFLEQQLAAQPVDESEVRQWYESHRNTCVIPQKARASHLFLTIHDAEKPAVESEIRRFHQMIVSGQASLADLARKHSDDSRTKSKGGDLGWFSYDRVPEDFAKEVFQLAPNQLSKPFLTRLGWHIVLLHEKEPSRPATYEECRDEIFARLEDLRRTELLKALLQSLRQTHHIKIHAQKLATVEPPTS